ncbi:apolipoprotein N-acyltransferase [Microbulbifer aestuariivivens]|uniref:Apolipoprotein N-acyltransferase n=1 Tax=Microbulbifer aestuariivivens TaxID=1908308 RepID=A0ABP9WLZ6_9GAMM
MRKLFPALAAAIAGSLMTLSFAPFDLWPAGLLSLALLAWLSLRAASAGRLGKRAGFKLAFCFGLGLFASGGSWVYVSITDFGGSSMALGLLLTGAFVAILAAVLALPFLLLGRFTGNALSFALAFPALWLLSEWLRTWLFTGFPWLFAGYGHIDTWLAGWAPVLSVYGVGLLLALSAAAIALLAAGKLSPRRQRTHLALLIAVALTWPAGALLSQVSWTTPGEDIAVGLVQANIPQEKKWLPEFRGETISRYQEGTRALTAQKVDVIIWPEAALPLLHSQAPNLMQALQRNADQTGIDLISGILYDRIERPETGAPRRLIHNSAAVFGSSPQVYHKRHLVPFGEYVPLEDWLRDTIEFFNLPTSFIRPGPDEQQSLQAAGTGWAPLICYEIVYPALVADSALDSEVLLTISNDAWFGASIGPLQHMQMAQMRALETGRFLVRATNTGITAIVDPRGQITARLPQFERGILTGSVTAMSGSTPFMLLGLWPILALATAMLAAALMLQPARRATGEAVLASEAADSH